MRLPRRARPPDLRVSEPDSGLRQTRRASAAIRGNACGGCASRADTHDLAVCADGRTDHVAMGVEEPGDAQMLGAVVCRSGGTSRIQCQSWLSVRTRRGQNRCVAPWIKSGREAGPPIQSLRQMLRFLTAGKSHGPQLTVIVEGIPAGLPLDASRDIDPDLRRRQGGHGRGKRQQIEHDVAQVVSGVRGGKTLGSPITLVIHNRDWENWKGPMQVKARGFMLEAGDPRTLRATQTSPGS